MTKTNKKYRQHLHGTDEEIMNDYLSTHPFYAGMTDRRKDYWRKQWLKSWKEEEKYYETTEEFLLNLPNEELNIYTDNDGIIGNAGELGIKSNDKEKTILAAANGVWCVQVKKFMNDKMTDISIGVIAASNSYGGCYRYSPELIEEDITTRFGKEIYLKWKEQVLNDLPSLKELICLVRKHINQGKLISSLTTCSRSAKLCERVGIPVRNEVAFLLPLQNKPNGFQVKKKKKKGFAVL